MQRKIKTFHLVESEPHPLVAQALNADLWTRCRIENPVPVHFIPLPRWGGTCPDIEDTKEGEIQLADSLLSNSKKEDWMANSLMLVYLHELSHRLTPGHDHDAAFFAVNTLLLLRAGCNNYGRPLLHGMDLYDLHEWEDTPNCRVGEALDWALTVAGELMDADMSAEAAATEILVRYEKWKAWKTAEPERAAKTEAKASASKRAMHEQIKDLSDARYRWAFAAFIGGLLFTRFINLVF